MLREVLMVFLFCFVAAARANSTGMDFGDAFALILGLFLGTIGILACLGKYSRKVAAGQF